MFSKLLWVSLGAVGVLFGAANSANALTLADLTGTSGSTVTEGNLVFSNFTYGGTTPASNVLVTTTATGLQFSATGWTTPNGSSVIGYDLSTTSGSIQTANLDFTATATGSATASVGETITDPSTGKHYPLQVFVSGITGATNQTSDTVTLNPTATTLHIVKSIDVASSGTGSATITLVDNTFSPTGGTPPPVPEPMSLALLPLALAGLGLRKKFAR